MLAGTGQREEWHARPLLDGALGGSIWKRISKITHLTDAPPPCGDYDANVTREGVVLHPPLGKERRMRRLILLLSLMAVTLVVASGVALAIARSGGPGNDTLRGTNGPDALAGNGGDDVLLGFKGRDVLAGGDGRDAVLGGNEFGPLRGDRSLAGGDGGDFVGTGRGADNMSGGPGRDILVDYEFEVGQQDVISGGDGDDAIDVVQRPASRDVVACGSGTDGVLVDSKDLTSGCERIFTSFAGFYGRFVFGSNYDYFEPLNRL